MKRLLVAAMIAVGCQASDGDLRDGSADLALPDLALCVIGDYWCDPECPPPRTDGCPGLGGHCSHEGRVCLGYPGLCEFTLGCIGGSWQVDCQFSSGPSCIRDMAMPVYFDLATGDSGG